MRSSIIICTRDRPADLLACVRSLAGQDAPPDEVIVVDASQPANARRNRAEAAAHLDEAGIAMRYDESPRASLPAQRNRGVEVASGDVLFFLDDDVVALPDFHRTVRDLYAQYGDAAAGIQGVAINARPASLKYRFYRRVFLPQRPARGLVHVVHPSGEAYARDVTPTGAVADVEWMHGFCMSYRRFVFDRFRFDEALDGYAAGEDMDFSYRVSRQHRLLVAWAARVIHTQSGEARLSLSQLAEMRTVNRYYLFRKNMQQSTLHKLAFAWGSVGHMLFSMGLAVKYRSPRYFMGTLSGWLRIRRGDIPSHGGCRD